MTKTTLKPSRPGLIVRDPKTLKPLAESGELKPLDSYWLRRLKGGDVVEGSTSVWPPLQPEPAEQPKPKPQAVAKSSKSATTEPKEG